MKRNYIQEILEIRQRVTGKSRFWLRLPDRVTTLQSLFKLRAQLPDEGYKYFPIALVACLESYFRLCIRELIDSDSRFSDNVEQLSVPNLKFDTGLVKAIAGKTITLGELVAHLIPLNNLEALNTCMSTLSGQPFLSSLATFKKDTVGLSSSLAEPILQDAQKVFADVARTFELRHIYAHEAATRRETIDKAEIERCFASFVTFLDAASKYIWHLLHPGPSLTQTQINQLAGEQFTELETERLHLSDELEDQLDGKRKELFENMNALFKEYRDAYASFFSSEYEGGTIWSSLFSSDKSRLTQELIARLKPREDGE